MLRYVNHEIVKALIRCESGKDIEVLESRADATQFTPGKTSATLRLLHFDLWLSVGKKSVDGKSQVT